MCPAHTPDPIREVYPPSRINTRYILLVCNSGGCVDFTVPSVTDTG